MTSLPNTLKSTTAVVISDLEMNWGRVCKSLWRFYSLNWSYSAIGFEP
jgi:hypothetical protein